MGTELSLCEGLKIGRVHLVRFATIENLQLVFLTFFIAIGSVRVIPESCLDDPHAHTSLVASRYPSQLVGCDMKYLIILFQV
jgi:hypothetical protein